MRAIITKGLTLTTIAAEKNSTIVFPLPIDMLQGIVGAKK